MDKSRVIVLMVLNVQTANENTNSKQCYCHYVHRIHVVS